MQKITAEDEFDTGIICDTGIIHDSKKDHKAEIIFAADAILDNRNQLIIALTEDVDEKSSTRDKQNYDEKDENRINLCIVCCGYVHDSLWF